MALKTQLLTRHLEESHSLFELLLRGHLWVDSVIMSLIEAALPHPQALDLDRMPFAQKIALGVALGAIDEEQKDALLALNRLRNRLAHDVEAVPGSKDIEQAVRLLPSSLRSAHDAAMKAVDPQEYARQYQDDKDMLRLRILFIVTLMYLEHTRALTDYEREHHFKLVEFYAIKAAKSMYDKSVDPDKLRKELGLPQPPHPGDPWNKDEDDP